MYRGEYLVLKRDELTGLFITGPFIISTLLTDFHWCFSQNRVKAVAGKYGRCEKKLS
jgi:hypothetical protein